MAKKRENQIDTFAALARMFGRSDRAVRKWPSSRQWPESVPKRPPWTPGQVRQIGQFAEGLRPPNNPGGGVKAKSESEAAVDLDLKQQRARLYRIRADREAGKLHDRSACQSRMVAAIRAVRAGMEGIAESLPAELRNEPATAWPTLIRKRFDELCDRFAGNVSGDRNED